MPTVPPSSVAVIGVNSAQPSSSMSVDSSDSASPASSWSSVLGKRKTELLDLSLSSRKSARIDDAKIRIHSIVGAAHTYVPL
jgi:RNA-dependent RNA polymerase